MLKTKQAIRIVNQAAEENGGLSEIIWGTGEVSTVFDEIDYKIKLIHVEGGGEGDGEEHWAVISISDGSETTLWRIPGWYQSYHGGELEVENMFKCEEYQKTVRDWREIE